MNNKSNHSQVLAYAVSVWFRTFAGTSALDVATHLSLDHEEALKLIEDLCKAGHGTSNRNIELYQIAFDSEDIDKGFDYKLVTTHIFFPSIASLREAFFSSDLPQQNLPEYKMRLYLGAHQIGLIFFSEEVLARYFIHPEYYRVIDSLAGGNIRSLSTAPEDRTLYVRYGKSKQATGRISVTAIYKDLAAMSPPEQRYWHSHEIETPQADITDPHFQRFLRRTYKGDFVNYPDPISDLINAMSRTNDVFTPNQLFIHLENVYLRMPVEQTYKSFCDSASELYKVVGPDGISQSTLKAFLCEKLRVQESLLVHKESGRPLSTPQLLELIETMLGLKGSFTQPLRKVSGYRVEADHKVLPPETTSKSYSQDFANLCSELSAALLSIRQAVIERCNDS